MARQGLMDDSGYDFFDAGDCANYESCREDAYNDGYQQGKTDVLKDIAKIIDDYACDRDVKSNISLGQMISQYIYKQTKEQKNGNNN